MNWAAPAVVVALLTGALMGCGGDTVDAIPEVERRLVAAPRGGVIDIPARLPGERRLVVTFVPPGGNPTPAWRNHLFWFDLETGRLDRLPLPDRAECRETSHDVARALPDGRVAYLEECWGQENPRSAKRLRAWDPTTGEVDDLRPYALPIGANHYTFHAAAKRGVINDGRGLYERLQWLGERALEPLKLPFERAGYPSWSTDGRMIAVDAVPAGEEGAGVARLELPRRLYLLDASGRVMRTLLDDLVSAGASSWSPDDQQLALPLEPEDGNRGFYLVDIASGERQLVLEGDDFGGSVWLDGDTVVVATGLFAQIERDGRPTGLYVLDLPKRGRSAD